MFFATLFSRVVRYRDSLGKEHLFNKGSFKKWIKRHGEKAVFHKMGDINGIVFKILMKERNDFEIKKFTDAQFDHWFNNPAQSDQSKHRIQLLPPKQVNENLKRFSNESLKHLSLRQIQGLNLKLMTKEQCDELFNRRWDDECKQRLKLLKSQQIQEGIEVLTFRNLTDEQIRSLDLSLLTDKKLNDLLSDYMRTPSAIQALSNRQLKEHCYRLNENSLIRLSNAQVHQLIPIPKSKSIKRTAVARFIR